MVSLREAWNYSKNADKEFITALSITSTDLEHEAQSQ